MKKLILVTALGFASILSAPAQAATATGNFDVNINLTSACVYAKTSDVQFNYTSFQAAAQVQTTAGGFTVKCTNLLPYTMALDSAGSYTDAAVNLAYTLALSAAGGTGNGAAQTYSVTGSMAANQSGNCATTGGACNNSASANKQRTLTITY
ncbi:spore coat protein U domain-containing protein [Polaromonas sp. SM01]|uniref:spore coat protein U domain-containing protein n=1 Tax=Polaromonas sp. SM01 TaxID=3085630 RepID=UPI00298229EC|nr:spore coat protein U domain-containing protein [Polaromonas sp. SM01]MDW5442461.1 spore coat protein U domain-containing protein [Polaromonas sp. SM01]